MTFTPKDWIDGPVGPVVKDSNNHYWRVDVSTGGVLTTTDLGTSAPSATPLSAAALEDMETRLSAYTDAAGSSGAQVTRATTQSIPNATYTPLSFSTEVYDDAGYWVVGSPTIFTIPADGTYLVTASALFDVSSGGNHRLLYLVQTRSAADTQFAMSGVGGTSFASAGAPRLNAAGLIRCLTGDTIRADVYQDSGAARNILVPTDGLPRMSIARV